MISWRWNCKNKSCKSSLTSLVGCCRLELRNRSTITDFFLSGGYHNGRIQIMQQWLPLHDVGMGACTDWIGRTGEAVCGKAWLEKIDHVYRDQAALWKGSAAKWACGSDAAGDTGGSAGEGVRWVCGADFFRIAARIFNCISGK